MLRQYQEGSQPLAGDKAGQAGPALTHTTSRGNTAAKGTAQVIRAAKHVEIHYEIIGRYVLRTVSYTICNGIRLKGQGGAQAQAT